MTERTAEDDMGRREFPRHIFPDWQHTRIHQLAVVSGSIVVMEIVVMRLEKDGSVDRHPGPRRASPHGRSAAWARRGCPAEIGDDGVSPQPCKVLVSASRSQELLYNTRERWQLVLLERERKG
jgi:hypothetical protein